MSISKLKDLFGGEEVMLELIESNTGEMILRNGHGAQKELVKIQLDADIKEVLGERTHILAQQMVQMVLFNLLEQQLGEWHANVIDEPPQYYS